MQLYEIKLQILSEFDGTSYLPHLHAVAILSYPMRHLIETDASEI